jgi:hypothetical protein
VGVQGRKQGREFGGGKIALAFFFMIAFDSLSRIVSAHLLANCQGQHFRQESGEAIGAVRGAFAHFSMQAGIVGMTFKLPGFRFQGLISQRHRGALLEQMLTFEARENPSILSRTSVGFISAILAATLTASTMSTMRATTGVSIAINFGQTTAHIRKFDRGRLRLYRVGAKARPATFSQKEQAEFQITFIFLEAEVFPKNFLY